jgi:hypothetical protein
MIRLIVGTSVGAINGGLIASGRIDARTALPLFEETLGRVFQRTGFIPKYDRERLREPIERALGKGFALKDCAAKYLATSVDEVTGRTHYFKSWEPEDGGLPMVTAMQRSSAAPLFFGGIVDEKERAVWLDGGTGAMNCPLLVVVNECLRQGWCDGTHRVHVLNVGTGWRPHGMPFERARRRWMKNLREVFGFLDPEDGGMARLQSAMLGVDLCMQMAAVLPWFTVQTIDTTVTEELDKMDAIEYAAQYKELGANMARTVGLAPLDEPNTIVVLSLPGGGAMGLIQLACLAEIERMLKHPLVRAVTP